MNTDPRETSNPQGFPPQQGSPSYPPPSGGYPPPPGSYPPLGGGYAPPGTYPPPPSWGPGAPGYQGYPPPGGPYGAPYGAPPQQPAPAGLGGLIQKYVNVTTRPGVASFWNELPTANWRDVWLPLIALGILQAITGAIAALYQRTDITFPSTTGGPSRTIPIGATTHWGAIIGTPLGFFILMGILFLFARMFGGTGTFLQQSYAASLYFVPLEAVSAVLGLIPFLGGFAGFALWIYQIVLAIFAIAASQRLTTGKATAVVLLPAAILLVLACILLFTVAALIAAALNGGR